MYLKKIKLSNFRNYKNIQVTFTKGINIIYGLNAQGKTNLLESIYFLGITKSHRNSIDNTLIKNNEKYLSVEGTINNKLDNKYRIYIDNKGKKVSINNNNIKKISEYISQINIIIFDPNDLELIKGSPIIRRKFIDTELSQLYNNYFLLINEYYKILKLRNDYLKKINSKNVKLDKNYLSILTNYLVDKSIYIYKLRYKFINKINENATKIYKDITGLDDFYIKYKPSIEFNIENSDIKQYLINEYDKKLEYDIKTSVTNVGPHKDDFEFYLSDTNLKFYGSQGQQRIAVLSLKLSEISIFTKYKETTPILLLDDIFSELDDIKKNNLLKYISKNIQTIITTTELNSLDEKLIKKSKLFKVQSGEIIKIKEVKLNE